MSVKYTVTTKRPGLARDDNPKYYPVLTDRRSTDLRKLSALISQRSTLHPADIVAVIQAMIELIPELLQDGHTVRLDGFGIFNLHASGIGKTKPEEVTSKDITGVKMSFLADKHIKRQLYKTKFVKK